MGWPFIRKNFWPIRPIWLHRVPQDGQNGWDRGRISTVLRRRRLNEYFWILKHFWNIFLFSSFFVLTNSCLTLKVKVVDSSKSLWSTKYFWEFLFYYSIMFFVVTIINVNLNCAQYSSSKNNWKTLWHLLDTNKRIFYGFINRETILLLSKT